MAGFSTLTFTIASHRPGTLHLNQDLTNFMPTVWVLMRPLISQPYAIYQKTYKSKTSYLSVYIKTPHSKTIQSLHHLPHSTRQQAPRLIVRNLSTFQKLEANHSQYLTTAHLFLIRIRANLPIYPFIPSASTNVDHSNLSLGWIMLVAKQFQEPVCWVRRQRWTNDE